MDACPELALRKIEFNLAAIYTASNNFVLAKGWLDCVKGNSIIFERRKDIAILYNKIGDMFIDNTNKYVKMRIECYEIAAEYYAKSKDWYSYCQVGLLHAQLLHEINYLKDSIKVANKVLAACLYFNEGDILGLLKFILYFCMAPVIILCF